METRTRILYGVLALALCAVVAGALHRSGVLTRTAKAGPTRKLLQSGAVAAAAVQVATVREAGAFAETFPARAEVPPAIQPSPSGAAQAPTPQQPQELDSVPASRELLIGYSGGVIGETDPCG